MRRMLVLLLLLTLLLTGCGGRSFVISDRNLPTSEGTPVNSYEATRSAMAFTPVPTNPPAAPELGNPTDELTIVLGGEFGNGGYWTWEDISNLLGIYASYGAYVPVEFDGYTYDGVPVEYLFDYARANEYAEGVVVYDRSPNRYDFTKEQLIECETCVIALAPDAQWLVLVTPDYSPYRMEHLVRIDLR
jgi:hypothetical protein